MPERHGLSKGPNRAPEYSSWVQMRSRCRNPNNKKYPWYGARGIKVCERWDSFKTFLEDMGPRPSSRHSIDRYPDNKGNYEPGNCRWATSAEQAFNRTVNHFVQVAGQKMTLAEATSIQGLGRGTIFSRLARGCSEEEAVHPGPIDRANAKLTRSDVIAIRSAVGASIKGMARRFGVNKGTIKQILRRKTWKHV